MADLSNIKNVETKRREAVVVFCDTTGFSNFARRTADRPEVHTELLLSLYRRAHAYQVETKCFLKRECDGMMFVHVYDRRPAADDVIGVLLAIERFQKDCEATIRAIPYPRPDGFLVRVTMGVVWEMTITKEAPTGCAMEHCGGLHEYDYWEYATILASRMLDSHKKEPRVCCQSVKEVAGRTRKITFSKLPRERRVPDGVFPEDMQDQWAFGSKRS